MKKMFIVALFLSFNLLAMSSYTKAQDIGSLEGISMAKAKQIALSQVKGKIVHAKIEKDDGMMKYEFIIKAKDGRYEVEIDKATGKVLEVEKESSNKKNVRDDDRHEHEDDDDRYDD